MMATLFCVVLWAQAPAGTTLFSENFGGYAKDDVPSGSVSSVEGSRVVYGGGSVTYSCTNGGSTTKIYNENTGGGTAPEILVSKGNGTFVIAGIPSGGAQVITVSLTQNNQALTVEPSGTGYSGSVSGKPGAVGTRTFDITVGEGAAATFTLTFKATGSSNVRVDDILVTVKTAGESSGGDDPQPTTQDLYLKLSSDWAGWPAKYAIYYFNDTENGWSEFMTEVEGEDNTYTATIPVGYSKVIFVRFNSEKTATGNWDDKWSQTVDLTIPENKNHFTVTSGGTGSECDGVWAVYPVVPTFYVKGSFNNWGDGMEMTEGSYTFENLAADTYEIKVTDLSIWLGFDKLDKTNSSENIYEGSDGNIKFTLAEAGNVTVAYANSKITVTGNFVAPTTKFTVTVPEGTEKTYIAGNFNNWTPAEMTLKAGEKDVFELTVSGVQSDTVAYKYLAGADWKFEEVIENNRSYNAADEVSAWKAVPTIYKYAKVKEAPVNWTGHYIIAWADHKPHSAIKVGSSSKDDFVAADDALVFTDGDTISIMEGLDFAVNIRFGASEGAYTLQLPDGKYIYLPNANGVCSKDEATDMYLAVSPSTTQTGIQIGDKADMSNRVIYNNNTNYRSYTNKYEATGYILPTLYRLVDEAFDCQDGPYALLVNGTTVIPAKMEAKEGYNEYAMYASLVKGDSVQVLNTSCGGLWIPTLEEAGAADHFAKGVAAATVDSTGCYDFYFKQIPNDQKMYIGFGICADDTIRYTVRGKGGILGEDFENAFDSKQDTLPLALAAGKYELKVVVGEDWKGFEQLTDTAAGLTVGDQGNICFTLKEAGEVTVIYNDSVFKLMGNFYIPVPHYYLVGSMNNWKVGANELVAGNEDTLSVEMPLYGDYHYEFKVVYVLDEDTTWFGNTEAATMERGNSTGWWLGNDEFHAANVGLLTTNAGKYTFIFKNNENREISVVIPEGGTVVPETKVAMLEGMFSIAADAKAQFGRGNLVYNYGAQQWYFAEKQYDVLADANLRFGDENYRGSVDLLDWSCENSQYGLLPSNKDADFGDCAFVEWGNLFADESGKSEWSTLSTAEWNYLMARKDAENNKLWTTIGLIPAAASEDTLCGLVLFPDNWVAPAGISFAYGFYDITNDAELKANTLTYAEWATMEAAGAVFLPMGGSRAGHIGNNIGYDGKTETTTVNPETGWYCWVDNVGWYGYYWLSTPDARETHQHCANYVIFPGWNEGPTTADDDDIYLAPQVWSREKRRGNSVRLVHKTYDPHYYLAGTMTNWKADSIALLPLDAERVDSLGAVLNLKADSLYKLKVVRVQGDETTWFGLNETAAMTYGSSEGWWIYKSEGEVNQANVGLKTTKEAEYPVTLLVKDDHLVLSVAIPAPTPTAAVTGSMNNWEGQIPFELAEDEKTATLFVDNMKSGEYDFRMIIGGQERSNGWWFKRDVLGAAGITGNDENAMKLIADVDGDYTITWFFANDSIHFEFPAPAMFYVTGDSALVKDAAGLEKKDEWKAKAIKAEQDTLVLSLKADQEYKLKLIEDGNWEGGKVYGYDALTQEDKAGLSADNDNNIVFKLNEDGDVKVVYFWEEDTENDEWKMTFKLIGDFYVEPEIPHTYTVVGPSLPNKWEVTSTASDMTLVEGVYTYVLADVELKAGAHEYKIVEDHAWDIAFPQDGNASFSVEKDGIYDVTFTLNKETKAYTAVPELKQEIVIAPTAVLMGLAEVEPWTVGESMEVAEGFKTASITKHFVPSKAEGDTLKFKVVINDAWRSNAYLYHRGFVGADGITMNIEGDDCDMKVVVDVEGDYTFTWTFENDSIGITFPEKPEPVMVDGYYIIGLNGWNVTDLTEGDLLESTGIETNEFSINLTLHLNDEFKVVRVVDDVIQEWYPAEGDNYVVDDHHYGATTVYFRPNYNGNEDWFAGCIYVLPTSTVDIDNLDTNAPAVKILRDGQILIIKGTKTFNIQGQLVK